MFERTLVLITAIAFIGLALLLQSSSPATAGPLGILAVFFLIYIILVGVITMLLYGLSTVWSRIPGMLRSKKTRNPLRSHEAYYFASVIALGPVMLIGMNSVGQLELTEILLVVIFIALATFYVEKRIK